MFDYETYRSQQLGANPDRGLLVTFHYEAKQKKDGKFENIPFINIFMNKNDVVDRPVQEEDKVRFKSQWDAFLSGEEAPPDGMPISQVPFATPANVSACKAERIYTVEQLLETPDLRLQRAYLVNFKYQCRDMMEAKRLSGDYSDLKALIEKQAKEIEELKKAAKPKPRGRPRKNANTDASQ